MCVTVRVGSSPKHARSSVFTCACFASAQSASDARPQSRGDAAASHLRVRRYARPQRAERLSKAQGREGCQQSDRCAHGGKRDRALRRSTAASSRRSCTGLRRRAARRAASRASGEAAVVASYARSAAERTPLSGLTSASRSASREPGSARSSAMAAVETPAERGKLPL